MKNKKILATILIAFGINANANGVLTGDTRLACEAMLCLASPTKPQECSNALARYFSINAKKWAEVVIKRKNFLNLCPIDSSDTELLRYKNQILVNLDSECTTQSLNKRIEKVVLRVIKVCDNTAGEGNKAHCRYINIYGYRINPNLTNSCKLLQSSKYTDYNLKYTCNGEFYELAEWNRGYTLKEIQKEIYNTLPNSKKEMQDKLINITFFEYSKLPPNERFYQNGKYYKKIIAYYEKTYIKKDCWINSK